MKSGKTVENKQKRRNRKRKEERLRRFLPGVCFWQMSGLSGEEADQLEYLDSGNQYFLLSHFLLEKISGLGYQEMLTTVPQLLQS